MCITAVRLFINYLTKKQGTGRKKEKSVQRKFIYPPLNLQLLPIGVVIMSLRLWQ